MTVSIIISASREKDLNTTLESIGGLDFPQEDFEVIVVKDPAVSVHASLRNLKVLEESSNHASIKRNRGVTVSEGAYLAFIDDDVIVPQDWLRVGIGFMRAHECDGISGSEYTQKRDLRHALAASVFLSRMGLGTNCHHSRRLQKAPFYDHALCNCIIKKEVWESVDGFNEVADYHVDDTEFFYIAQQLGYKFFKVPELRLVHERRPFIFPYLSKIFLNATWTGLHTMIFPEIYLKIPTVKLMIAVLLMLPLLAVFSGLFPMVIAGYLLFMWASHVDLLKESRWLFILIAPAFFLHHLAGMLGFCSGITKFFFGYGQWQNVLRYKRERYTVIRTRVKGFQV